MIEKEMLRARVEAYVLYDRQEKSSKSGKEEVKSVIVSGAKELLAENSKSVFLEGVTGDVQVSFKEKMDIVPNEEFLHAYNSGKYPYIRKVVGIAVLPEHAETVIATLAKAGLAGLVTINEGFEFDSKRKIASTDLDATLKAVVKITETPALTVKERKV